MLRVHLLGRFSLVLLSSSGFLLGCGAAGPELTSQVGKPAPDLAGVDQHGTQQRIASERGHALVVYFYPKDGTPGCTKEACAFRDVWDKFKAANVQIFGVSADDEKSHADFAKEQKLPFPIVADPNHAWSEAFHVPSSFGMDSRVSFLIDASGKVAKVYPKVDPGVHADEVLGDAAALDARPPAPR